MTKSDLGGEIGIPVEGVRIKKPYDPSMDDPGLDCGVSLTKQADKDSCDVNLILKRFENTGVLPDMIRQDARYGDFTQVVSYQEAMNTVMHAEAQFNALSAKVRSEFDNDPAKMLAFCSDPKNKEKMIELGLALPPPVVVDKAELKESAKEDKKA